MTQPPTGGGTTGGNLPTPINRATFNTTTTRELAEAMTQPPDPGSVNRRWGIIAAIHGAPDFTVDVTIGGIAVPGLAYDAAYTPTVGEVVMLDVVGSDTVVIGTTAPSSSTYRRAVGDIEPSMASAPKANTLLCNGQAVSRSTYANLYGWASANGLISSSPTTLASFDFEDGGVPFLMGTNWTSASSTVRAHGGTHSVLFTRSNTTPLQGAAILVGEPVSPGLTYTFTGWFFASAATPYQLWASAPGGVAMGSILTFTPTANTWQQRTVTFTVPSGVTQVSMFITDDTNATPTSGSTLNVDDFSLTTTSGGLFGPGDGSTTFTIPDFRGRTPIGAGTVPIGGGVVGGYTYNVGDTPGANNQTLATAQMPSHNHTVTVAAHATHTHTLTAASAATGGSHGHSGTTANESANHTHNIGIRRSDSEATGYGLAAPGVAQGFGDRAFVSSSGSTATQGISNDHAHNFSTSTDSGHTHSMTGSSDAGGPTTHTVTQATVGGATPVDVRQPAFAVNWLIWY